jgi:hypothetical protein
MRHLLLAILAVPAMAQAEPAVVFSAAPDTVAVTLYRDPDRSLDNEIYRDNPSSFALIAETRTVMLPAGEVVVRFEGVASGIVPQSAILFGAPPRERNRDAALLSQRGLVDAFTGQRVVLRRTDPATGKTLEEPATIRSAADRLVVSTPHGIEAVYCSGLNQALVYPNAPAALSAKPVLSMLTKNQPGGTMTITLAYIATGFDWDATYVGTLAPNGKSMTLLGWMTMASGDDTSFPEATTSAVAGKVNRSDATRDNEGRRIKDEASSLNRSFGCWPSGTTSDGRPALPPPPAAPMAIGFAGGEEIIVTARRRSESLQNAPMTVAVIAKAENLGDLKLYRIPVPVTVVARSQKQVAFMVKDHVRGEVIYRSIVYDEPEPPELLFHFRNRKADGMGDPLPAGKAVLYQMGRYGRTLVGEASTADKAVDEDVDLVFGRPDDVTVETETPDKQDDKRIVTIRNATPYPVIYDAEFPVKSTSGYSYSGLPKGLTRKPGKRVWRTTVPANGTAVLTYTLVDADED